MLIRITAEIAPAEAAIDRVEFFAETNLVAAVTNSPYRTWFEVDSQRWTLRNRILTAVAFTKTGLSSKSAPVVVGVLGGPPPFYVYGITSPADGEAFLPSATFTFSAEPLAAATLSDGLPTEFYIGTNVVGRFNEEPYSMVISNLDVGTYKLTVKKDRMETFFQPVITVRVADLIIQSAQITADRQLAIGGLTAYPGRQTVLESASDLGQWRPLQTNTPPSSTIQFLDPSPADSRRFYRVVVSP